MSRGVRGDEREGLRGRRGYRDKAAKLAGVGLG